ncbi:MAG: PfkB family carbohydrate kinase [Micropepsaceae bacterium]
MTKRIVCFGEILLRLAPPGRELLLQTATLHATFAGAEANVAVALASFGHDAEMLTVVPDGALGDPVVAELRRWGVEVRRVKRGPGRLGLFFYTPGAVRRPSEIHYDRAGSSFAAGPSLCADATALDGADWFHVSGVTPALGRTCADAAIAMARAARARGVGISFDGNYRSKLWESWHDEAPGILHHLFEAADILFGDERDIGLVLGKKFANIGDAVAAAFTAFPQLKRVAYSTRSQRAVEHIDYGAKMHTRTTTHEVAATELSGIVDRVGTGDAFAAGIIHGLLTGMNDADALKFGHAAASLKHSIPGDFLTLGEAAVRAAMTEGSLDVRR